jgi:large subunit ribosomal protein L24
MRSIKARKQRKTYFNAPLHKKQNNIASHLEENLLLKYDRRSVPLIKGDTVKIMRGAHKGHEDKVAKIHVKDYRVEIEGVTITKADGKKIAKPIHPSNLLITKLNLTDKWRRKNLEKRVSVETKKEIEAEAKQQLIELEEEKKRAEEELISEEQEAQQDQEIIDEDILENKPSSDEKKIEDKTDKKKTVKNKEKSSEDKKKGSSNAKTDDIKKKNTKEKKSKKEEDS